MARGFRGLVHCRSALLLSACGEASHHSGSVWQRSYSLHGCQVQSGVVTGPSVPFKGRLQRSNFLPLGPTSQRVHYLPITPQLATKPLAYMPLGTLQIQTTTQKGLGGAAELRP